MKTLVKILFIFLTLISFQASYAEDIDVETILEDTITETAENSPIAVATAEPAIKLVDVVDTKTLNVFFTDVKMWVGELLWEVKLLNDLSIAFADRDIEENTNKVVIALDEALETNTDYSLLTVFGADGSIDFTTEDSLEWVEILNDESDEIGQSIQSITLVNANTLHVVYKEALDGEEFEFKILSDITVDGMKGLSEDSIEITLEWEVGASKNYIFMVISLEDALSQTVELEEGIYDFVTPSEVSSPVSEEEMTISEPVELENEVEVELDAAYEELTEPQESEFLEEADVEAVVEEAVVEEEAALAAEAGESIEVVALSATVTPDTGAETWVLILLTLFINTFYYFSRRKA